MGQKQGVRDVGLAFFLSLVYQPNQFTTTLIKKKKFSIFVFFFKIIYDVKITIINYNEVVV